MADLFPNIAWWTTGPMIEPIKVLDVAACEQVWARCSSPKVDSYEDVCVPCDGKIYAFNALELAPGKVFDPASGKWNDLAGRLVDEMGGDIIRIEQAVALNDNIFLHSMGHSSIVFNRGTQDWQTIENKFVSTGHTMHCMTRCVVMEGKLYRFSRSTVEVLCKESGSWTFIQFTSFENIKLPTLSAIPRHPYSAWSTPVPVVVAPFGSEVLAIFNYDYSPQILCRSVGFGVQDQCLVWEVVSPQLPQLLNKYGSFCDFSVRAL